MSSTHVTHRSRWLARIALLALGVFAGAGAAPAQERAVEVHKPSHRPASELVGIAEIALGDEGSAAADPGTNSLILIGSRAAVDRALALVRAQDQPRRSVTLHWSSRDQAELEAAGIRVDWSLGSGSVRVGTVIFPENRVEIGADVLRTDRERRLEGVLRLLDGETGEIGAGRSVPVRSRDVFGRGTTEFVAAEQGFRATPRVLGSGKVRVEIQPIDAQVDLAGRTRFAGASTIVEVEPGQTILLGQLTNRADEGSAGTRVLSTNRRERDRVFLLRVELH